MIPAIILENVSVLYRHEKDRPTSLKELFVRRNKGPMKKEYIRAIDDVSIQVTRGEVFGVIGRNGAGKTTLLKVMSKIVYPSKGRMRIWGSTASLFGVGSGFHPELTGRENVYLYSAILGRSQSETKSMFQWIVDFSELHNFIDSPIRTYSSGMVARLGFATAMAKRPEIFLVDETLEVGDDQFRNKCKDQFREMVSSKTTIVLVSHSMATVLDLCDRAVWLDKGKIQAIGEVADVVNQYKNE